MFKKSSFKVLGLLATLALAIVLSACGNGGSGSSSDGNTSLGKKDVNIPYIASDNSTPRSLVIAEVLKKLVTMLLLRQYKRVVHYMRQYLKTLTHSTHQASSLQLIKAFTINSKVI